MLSQNQCFGVSPYARIVKLLLDDCHRMPLVMSQIWLTYWLGGLWASLIGKSPSVDSQCPGCVGQAVVTLRLPCAIVESPRRHKRAPFLNIAFLRSRLIKRRQWTHKLDYYGVVFVHLATECGIKAKDPSGLDSDRWIQHSRCCGNSARAKALAGFSRHLSAGFTDLNPAPPGLSLYRP